MACRALWIVICLSLANLCGADQILLTDGSSINGEVISMQNGVYQVQTSSMGVVSLKQSQVQSISQRGAAPISNSPLVEKAKQVSQSAVQSLQSSMSNNAGIMTNIRQLQNDPDMQAVLQDPEVMQLVQSFDFEALKNHPKIKQLMNNSTVRNIQGKVN